MIPINTQEPLKADYHPLGYLKVHSVFATIQGEGPNAGIPAVFLRLAGCNLQCPGCDTEYTLGAEEMTPIEVLKAIEIARDGQAIGLVVITGGEPFRQDIGVVAQALIVRGFKVQVESNGTLYPYGCQGLFAHSFSVVISPKSGKVNPSLQPFIIAYKYVLDADFVSEEDGLPTSVLGMPASPARQPIWMKAPIYLQPADHYDPAINKANENAAIKSCMKFGYRYCAQLHKFLNLP